MTSFQGSIHQEASDAIEDLSPTSLLLATVKGEPHEEENQCTEFFDEDMKVEAVFPLKVEVFEISETNIGSTRTLDGQPIDPLKIEPPEKLYNHDYKATQTTLLAHVGGSFFKCHVCDFTSIKCSALTEHIRTHTAENTFQCSECNYITTTMSYLKQHKRRHGREQPFKCSVCDYGFSKRANLTIHMRTHTGNKPFKCKECDYSSTQLCNLTQHMRAHTGQKPFKCTICDFACLRSGNLTVHMRMHT